MKTSRKDRWSAYRQAELEFLSAGEIRIRIRDLYANLRAGRLAERKIKDRDLECFVLLHEFAGTCDHEQPVEQAWSGTYFAWAAKAADALFVTRYRDMLLKFLDLRFPDTRAGAKGFGHFVSQLRPGEVMQNFPQPKDRSNPLDPVAWEIGFAAGRATEALNTQFSTPERTGTENRKTIQLRDFALRALTDWRERNRTRKPTCKDVFTAMKRLKLVEDAGAGIRWDGGSVSEKSFGRHWSRFKEEPEFQRLILQCPAKDKFAVSA